MCVMFLFLLPQTNCCSTHPVIGMPLLLHMKLATSVPTEFFLNILFISTFVSVLNPLLKLKVCSQPGLKSDLYVVASFQKEHYRSTLFKQYNFFFFFDIYVFYMKILDIHILPFSFIIGRWLIDIPTHIHAALNDGEISEYWRIWTSCSDNLIRDAGPEACVTGSVDAEVIVWRNISIGGVAGV